MPSSYKCQRTTMNKMASKIIEDGPIYSYTLPWEADFDYYGSLESFYDNWYIPFVWSFLVYLPLIYLGQYLMKDRQPFSLKIALILWNGALCIFSVYGLSRVLPEFIWSYKRGIHHTVCNNSFTHSKEARYWVYVFALSKIPEYVDTVFLVLRKRPIIFLHVYHHASVVILSWFEYASGSASARWFYTMNYAVHSLMYAYYALKVMPNFVRIPKWVSMLVTTLQTLQMIMGTYVVAHGYYTKLTGGRCDISMPISLYALVTYTSYLILFSRFFYQAYCAPRAPRGKTDKKHD